MKQDDVVCDHSSAPGSFHALRSFDTFGIELV